MNPNYKLKKQASVDKWPKQIKGVPNVTPCQSAEAQWFSEHFLEDIKISKRACLRSHLRAMQACRCLHTAINIWRKLKQMKTNTSFLMLLELMKYYCNAFFKSQISSLLLPSHHTPLRFQKDFTQQNKDARELNLHTVLISNGAWGRWGRF